MNILQNIRISYKFSQESDVTSPAENFTRKRQPNLNVKNTEFFTKYSL